MHNPHLTLQQHEKCSLYITHLHVLLLLALFLSRSCGFCHFGKLLN